MKNFNQLTPAEAERLSVLIEECGEVIQAAAKIQRHGWTAVDNSVLPPVQYDNRRDLETELGHVRNIVNLMIQQGDVGSGTIDAAAAAKRAKWDPYLHHNTAPDGSLVTPSGKSES